MTAKSNFEHEDLIPLKRMVEHSNPGRLHEVSDHWKSVETELRSAAEDLQKAVQHASEHWEGTAAQGFTTRAGQIQTSIANTADHAANTSSAMKFAGDALQQTKDTMGKVRVPSSFESGAKWVSDLGDRSDAQFKADLASGMDRFAAVNKNRDELSATEISHQYAIGIMEHLGPQYTQAAAYLKTPPDGIDGGEGYPPKPENPTPQQITPQPTPQPHYPESPNTPPSNQPGHIDPHTPTGPGHPTMPTPPIGTPPIGTQTPPVVHVPGTGIDHLPPSPTVNPPGIGTPPVGGGPGIGGGGGGLGGPGVGGGGGGLGGGGFPGGLGGGLGGLGGGRGGSTGSTSRPGGAGSTSGGGTGAGGRGAGSGAAGTGAAGQGRGGAPGMGGMHAPSGGAGGGKGAGGKGGSGLVRRGGGTVGGARAGGASGRAFTEGGSGLGKGRGQNGAPGAGGAHGMGGAAGNKKKGKNGNRPDYLVEDEDTWRTGGSANPPVIE